MRKLTTCLILLMVLTLSGCSFRKEIDTSNPIEPLFVDGTYSVSSTYYDANGYRKSLTASVHDGIITEIHFQEIDKNGQLREELPLSQLKWNSSELNYLQILQQLYEETLLRQSDNFDTIAGATKTVSDYNLLLETLLEAASEGSPTHQTLDTFNDTYTVVNEVDPVTGSQEQMTVIYRNGEIASIQVQEVTNNASFYVLGKTYSQLADTSLKNKSLDKLNLSSVDENILDRYNDLLDSIKELRGM